MDKTWQLQEAKSHFSELVSRAESGETHIVTKHGEKAVVVIGYEHYLQLSGRSRKLLEALRTEPFFNIELERDKDIGRELEL